MPSVAPVLPSLQFALIVTVRSLRIGINLRNSYLYVRKNRTLQEKEFSSYFFVSFGTRANHCAVQ